MSTSALVIEPLRTTPPLLALVGVFISIVLFLLMLRSTGANIWLKFLSLAIFLRYFVSEFPSTTHSNIGGFSIISLVSLATIFFGLLLVIWHNSKNLVLKPFACIYVVIFAMLFSGALNNYLINSLEASLRWVYLLVICIVSTQALKNSTNKQFLDALTLAIFCPICFQLLSIFLGYSKSGEADGSASWIGGYNHESGFSLIALTLIFVAALRVVCRLRFGWSLILIGVISLLASNYRTTMIAGIPVIFTVFIAYGDLKLKGQDKLLLPGLAVAGIAVLIALASQFQDRFSDLGKTVELFPKLIAPPDAYTREAQQLLSARFYIWSKYLTAFFEGGFAQQFVGFGPDSWKQTFPKYAHNTFVSALYEIGYIGCTLIIWALWSLARLSLHGTSKPLRSVLLAAHLGFFIVNFATMPLWNIEGIIYYGILVGFTYYSKIAPRPEKYS